MVFEGGTVLKWRPLQYLFVLGPGSHCLGVFDNGAQGTLLGGIAVRDVLVQVRGDARAGWGGSQDRREERQTLRTTRVARRDVP